VQKEIVAEIEGYQKVIDGARAVLDNYRPHIPIDPDWPMVALSDVAEVIMGQSPPGETYNNKGEGVPLINGPVEFGAEPFSRTVINQYTTAPTRMCRKDDLIICVRGATLGRMNISGYDGCIGRGVAAIRSATSQRWIEFLIFAMRDRIFSLGVGSTFPSITQEQLRSLPIPLPPLATQQAIVAEIEDEQALVFANRELIERFEKKIQGTLARIWGEEPPSTREA
jgi:type I restriction enzyme S subunit